MQGEFFCPLIHIGKVMIILDANIKTTTLEVSSRIYSGENTCSAECDLIVPDNMPDIRSVLQISASCATSACDPQTDRILLTGNVFFNILYVSDLPGREVRSINAKAVFSNIFSSPGVRDDMTVFSSATVSAASYKLANCRKLSVHGDVRGTVNVYSNSSLTLPTQIEGAEVKTVPLSCSVIKAVGSAQESITDSFELPPSKPSAVQILRDEVKITDKAVKVIHNKAIIKGTACVSVLYSGESGIEQAKTDIPFTKVVSVDGLEENMDVSFTIDIQGWETKLTAAENGENRVIDVETMLYFHVAGRVCTYVEAIADAYFPGKGLKCVLADVTPSPAEKAELEECGVKGVIKLPPASGEIESIYDIKGFPGEVKVSRREGDIVMEAFVTVSVLYKTNNPEERTASYSYNVEYSHSISGEKYSALPSVKAELKHMSCSVGGGNSIDVRGLMYLTLTPNRAESETVVTSAEITDEEKSTAPSVLISYITSDKSLWDIAKGYNISPSKLMAANGINTEDELKGRQALVIPR